MATNGHACLCHGAGGRMNDAFHSESFHFKSSEVETGYSVRARLLIPKRKVANVDEPCCLDGIVLGVPVN